MSYQPRPQDIAFAKLITGSITDGGTWGVPATGQIFTFDKKTKTMKLMNPDSLEDAESRMIFERAQSVFKEIGWKVEALGNA